MVAAALPGPSELVIVRTTGDARTEVPLDEAGGVGLFTKELERALLDGEIDLAVHSLKDLPVAQPAGLVLAAIPARAPVSDLLLVRPDALEPGSPLPLRQGARVGSSSARRRALLRGLRQDLEVVPLRGNVPTRVRRCAEGRCDAAVLARAGVERLGLDPTPLAVFELNPALWPCAPAQGALGLEARADDAWTLARVAALDDGPSRAAAAAERRLLQASGGGCHSAFGAWAQRGEGEARLHLVLVTPEGALRKARFARPVLDDACADAMTWLASGAPELGTSEDGWLCRPYRSSS
jgi:hydroxymethylbilane synthase